MEERDGALFTALKGAHRAQAPTAYASTLSDIGGEILKRTRSGQSEDAEFPILALLSAASERTGELASCAQQALGNVFVEANEEARKQILNTALEMCRTYDPSTDEPLSPMVLYMAGRAPVPPNGANGDGFRDGVHQLLEQQIPNLEHAFDQGRMIWDSELIAACQTLGNLSIQDLPVTMPARGSEREVNCLEQFAVAAEALKSDPFRPVVLLVNSDDGSPGAVKHWIPVVGAMSRTGQVEWHMFNTDAGVDRVDDAVGKLGTMVFNSPLGRPHLHRHEMQLHTSNSCASLSFQMLKFINATAGSNDCHFSEQIGAGMDYFGTKFCHADAEKQKAVDLRSRAEIMQHAANVPPRLRSYGPPPNLPPLPANLPPDPAVVLYTAPALTVTLPVLAPALPTTPPPVMTGVLPPDLPDGLPPVLKPVLASPVQPPRTPPRVPSLPPDASSVDRLNKRGQKMHEEAAAAVRRDLPANIDAVLSGPAAPKVKQPPVTHAQATDLFAKNSERLKEAADRAAVDLQQRNGS